MGHMSENRTQEGIFSTAWWLKWEQDLSEYISSRTIFQKANRSHGKRYALLQKIEEPMHPWEIITVHSVTGKTTAILKKGCSTLLPVDYLKKNLLSVNPKAKDLQKMWKTAFEKAEKCIVEAELYNKQIYENSHQEPAFKKRIPIPDLNTELQ
ncbi:hypothetical protein O181_084334 [Austropuccinia psidii MF-1]|uniref:Uncharacterized protein n=1 Tax=Austropuccinia psidii MF-1 TaxID=1389203 RepID=A0A9Q3FSY4_9BASI|nr:hypothetical protein [Austropuccinia psidii MF-1]